MDVELGIGVDCIDPVMRTRRKTMRKNVVAQRMKEDTRGEDLRVLYCSIDPCQGEADFDRLSG